MVYHLTCFTVSLINLGWKIVSRLVTLHQLIKNKEYFHTCKIYKSRNFISMLTTSLHLVDASNCNLTNLSLVIGSVGNNKINSHALYRRFSADNGFTSSWGSSNEFSDVSRNELKEWKSRTIEEHPQKKLDSSVSDKHIWISLDQK